MKFNLHKIKKIKLLDLFVTIIILKFKQFKENINNLRRYPTVPAPKSALFYFKSKIYPRPYILHVS